MPHLLLIPFCLFELSDLLAETLYLKEDVGDLLVVGVMIFLGGGFGQGGRRIVATRGGRVTSKVDLEPIGDAGRRTRANGERNLDVVDLRGVFVVVVVVVLVLVVGRIEDIVENIVGGRR